MDSNSKERRDIFIELLSSNYNRIKSFILTLIPNSFDAEDVMQETSKLMWEKFDQYEIGTNFISWGFTIAKYQVLAYRKKYDIKVSLSPELIEMITDESNKSQENDAERLDALRGCIQELSPKDQELLNNRYQRRKTARELSKQFGVAMNTIYRNESRIITLLMKCIFNKLGISYL
jgi:RNA polymerase sigma-70 factor (ECF subfamily)